MKLVNTGEQRQIPIEDLFVSSLNDYEMEDMDSMKESVRTYGILSPVTVVKANDKYEILSGARRYTAAKQINEEDGEVIRTIPCLVIEEEVSDVVKQLIIQISNLETREMTGGVLDGHRMTVVSLYKQLADNGTIEQKNIVKAIAESLRISERYACMYMTIFENAEPELIDAMNGVSKPEFKKGEGSLRHRPEDVAAVARTVPKEEQAAVAERLKKGESAKDIIDEFESLGREERTYVGNRTEDEENPDDDIENMSFEEQMQYFYDNIPDIDTQISTVKNVGSMASSGSLYEKERSCVYDWMERIDKMKNKSKMKDEDKELLTEVVKFARRYETEIFNIL